MTNEEAINVLNSLKQYYNDKNEDSYVGFDNEDNEALDLAIKALEQQPCEDCISREKVFEQISCWVNSGEYRYTNATYYLTRRIQGISSVTPQQETGKWINKGDYAECSNCGANSGVQYNGVEPVPFNTRYCPNCGTKMEVEE
jgi:hypothetical protein